MLATIASGVHNLGGRCESLVATRRLLDSDIPFSFLDTGMKEVNDIEIPEEVDKHLGNIANVAASDPDQRTVILNYLRLAYRVGFRDGETTQAMAVVDAWKSCTMPAEKENG